VYLLDTNVISELRRKRPHGAVVAWLQTVPDANLHISAATIAELQVGIEMTRERNPAKAAELETWLEGVAATYNVLPMDVRIFRAWARLMHRQTGSLIHAMIAATAVVHKLTVATRNFRDFQKLGVRIFNPFTTSSG
jgi:toxin FitB